MQEKRALLDQKLYQEKDYQFFGSILKINTNRVAFEEVEFKKLNDITKYMKLKKQPYVVLDTTDIRAEPEIQLRELCSKLQVSFSREMIIWGEKPVTFHTEQNQEYEKIWYEKLFLSSELNPPDEVPPTLAMFPEFIQNYIQETNLPVYAHLSKEKNLNFETAQEITNRKFDVNVTENNANFLESLGVIVDKSVRENVSVKLRDIDPIHAIMHDPGLAQDKEFLTRKEKYAREINIVSRAIKENNEYKREMKQGFKLK